MSKIGIIFLNGKLLFMNMKENMKEYEWGI